METILYRAKRKYVNEWVYGYYAKVLDPQIDDYRHIIIGTDSVLKPLGEFTNYYIIIPETLGRLIGYACYDSCQEAGMLFQNDIIGVWERNADVDNTEPMDIALVTDEHSITVAGSGRWFPQDTTRVRILGNAYDNPKLLHGHDMNHFINGLNEYPGTHEEYLDQHHYLTSTYYIPGAQAACYMCNFENDYICHQYNGGCKRLEVCKMIREAENGRV